MRNGAALYGTTARNALIVGAGGWMTGHDVAADGTFIGRTDTYNAYTRKEGDTRWQPELIPGVTISLADMDLLYTPDGSNPDPGGQAGTYAVAICWSNSARRAIATFGYTLIRKSTTYVRSNLPQKLGLAPNEPNRMSGNPLAFDPANPDVLWAAYPDGVHYTHNATAGTDTWTSIPTSTLPAPTPGTRSIIRFDRNSAVTGGKTQGIYIFIPGSGLYKTTNAGANWTKVADRPTNPTNAGGMKINPANGDLFLYGTVGENTGQVSRLRSGSWFEPSGVVLKGLAVDPFNAGYIYGINSGGSLSVSPDEGTSWSGVSGVGPADASEIAWHGKITGGFAVSELDFDPTVRKLRFTGGVGAWYYNNPPLALDFNTYPVPVAWSLGNESMVMSGIVIAPDGTRGRAMHDRGFMISAPGKTGTFSDTLGPDPTRDFTHCQGGDYANEDTNFWIAAYTYLGTEHMSFTADMGETWTARHNLVSQSGGRGGGQVVCLTKDVWIAWQLSVYPYGAGTSNSNAPYITFNGRSATPTWQKITIGNGNAVMSALTRNHTRRSILKSRLTTGNIRRVYLVNPSDVDNPSSADYLACVGTYAIDVNLSAQTHSVSRLVSIPISPSNQDSYYGKLTECPNGDLLWCGGDNNVGGLKRLPYGGSAWEVVTGTDNLGKGNRFSEVFAAAAGKKAANSSAPHRLYAVGYRMNSALQRTNDHTQYGEWISDDDGVTWTLSSNFPGGNYDQVLDMAADWNVFGARELHFGGSGAIDEKYSSKIRAT